MKCPKCQLDMTVEEYHGIKIQRCPSCSGILVDKGDLETIDHRNLGQVVEAGTPRDSGLMDNVPAHCHACDNPMIALTGAGDIQFDWCDQCERIFFDRGELSAFDAFESTL